MRNITSLGQARDYGDRLSKLLKKYRELAKFRLTQGDLAARTGVSARSIRDWESGVNLPTARNLKRIIEVYHRLGLFTPGKEREQAEELWILRRGEDLSNTFPLFDATWLESVSSDKTVVEVNRQSSEHPATTDPEKNVTSNPTHLMAGNLPLQLTSFIGREKELTEIRQLLSHTRLLTITGSGGAGKTRLSQEIANQLQESAQTSYPDGVWWVELTPLTDPQQVVQAVVSALLLEGRLEGDLYELLQSYLQPKRLLLVLDNCEHLVKAVGGLVRKLLRDCPSLQILATSRESFSLTGEQVWPLAGLSVPRSHKPRPQPENRDIQKSAAVRLFVERAGAAQPLFKLNAENATSVLEICRQLDGLPLAIELAAARVKGLGVEQISRRLQQNFKLLSGGSQTSTPHHQTVQTMIDWSYNLLPAEEQLLLRRMAVFRDDFSLEAAEAVLGGDAGPGSERLDPDDVLILILQLVNKSLVVPVHIENNTVVRYRLLEMVRQHSQQKLEESLEDVFLTYKHLAYYTDFVEKGRPDHLGNQSAKLLTRLEQEYANLHSALTWATTAGQTQTTPVMLPVPPGELALRLSDGLGRFWFLKSYISEGEHWLKASLALDGLIEREDLKPVRAMIYWHLGNILVNQIDQAIHYQNLSLVLFEELENKTYMSVVLSSLGAGYLAKANYAEAKAFWLRSLALSRKIGDQLNLPWNLNNLGALAIYQGDLDEAGAFLQESEDIFRQRNEVYALANSLLNQSEVSRVKHDLPQALSKLGESLRMYQEIDNKQGIAFVLTNLSVIQRNLQHYGQARLTAEESLAICEEVGDAYILSYTYNNLAIVCIKEVNLAEARRFGRQSLEIRQKRGDKKGVMESLHTFALLAATQDRWEEFVWLYAAADTMRQQLGISRDYLNEQAELDRLHEQASLQLDAATLDRLKAKGQTDSLDEVLNQVLKF